MANTTQLFTVAGIVTQGTSTKVRFANDMIRRIKQFTKGKASRIDLLELPNAMTKIEALKYLASHADFQSASDQATIADTLEDKEKDAKKMSGEVKVKATKKPSLDAIKARAKKKEVTPEQILDAVDLHNVDPA
jgi:hypothetical protein